MSFIDYFPEEIVQEIFMKLPIKCLVRCTAVCKSWRSLIISSTFIDAHLRREIQSNNQDNVCGLFLLTALDGNKKPLFSLHLDNPALDEYTKLTSPLTTVFGNKRKRYTKMQSDIYVAGTCNGLVCLASQLKTMIWNPYIRKYVVLPMPILDSLPDRARCDFGYDSHTNDYKVLRSVNNFHAKQTACEVWSLARRSWKILSAGVVPAYFRPLDYSDREDVVFSNKHAFVNGALHWIPHPKRNKDEIRYIVSFDMFSERFAKIMTPMASEIGHVSISRYKESLALLVQNREKLLHVWVMKKYGVVESWAKLSTLPLQERIRYPLGFRKSGEILLKMYYWGCNW